MKYPENKNLMTIVHFCCESLKTNRDDTSLTPFISSNKWSSRQWARLPTHFVNNTLSSELVKGHYLVVKFLLKALNYCKKNSSIKGFYYTELIWMEHLIIIQNIISYTVN